MAESYHLKICSEKTGYEAKPKRSLKLDLMTLKDQIVAVTRMRVRVGVPALILLQGDEGEVINIFPSGRLLLRNFPSKNDVERMVNLLAPILYT
ncbi:MAG: hypothetical protein ACFFEF_13025 [Candidatus Thorarchaeota archaeon]